jgi:hypothetical protein
MKVMKADAELPKAGFDELPEEVKAKINIIMNHRKRVRFNIIAFGMPSAASLVVLSTVVFNYYSPVIGAIGDIIVAGIDGLAWSDHNKEFRKEYFELFKAVKRNMENKVIQKILKNPYFAVDSKGNLVGKKTFLRIKHFKFGRKRIISPKAKAEKIIKWKQAFKRGRKKLILK